MSSWCKDILSSIKDDSSWKASILIPSTIWHQNHLLILHDNNNQNSTDTITVVTPDNKLNEIDIIQLFSDSEHIKHKLSHSIITYNYPKTAIFHFESYDSFTEKDNLIQFIKKKAAENGNYLVIKSTKKETGIDNNYEIVLSCQHYGFPKKSTAKELQFNTNSLQASHTIIEPKHHATSRKNHSRSSYLKRVKPSFDDNGSKTNKCQTLKCGCSFSITIFFHHVSQRWFLKKKL